MSRILVSCFFAALICACSSVWSGGRESDEPDVNKEKLRQYEKVMHVTFPPSTRGLNAREVTGGIDDMLYLKVEIDRGDLESFLKSSPFANVELRSDRKLVRNEKDLPWWTPDNVKTYKSAQAALPDAKYLNILIDLDRGQKVVLYLTWHET